MSVTELQVATSDAHVASCSDCRQYLQDMAALSAGLGELVIPHPAGMRPPVIRRQTQSKWATLLVAAVLLLLSSAFATYVLHNYFSRPEPAPRSKRQLIRAPEPSKTEATPPILR